MSRNSNDDDSPDTPPPARPPVRQRIRPQPLPEPDEDVDDGKDPPSPAYKIGYGKPPVDKRFKPGKSGNPKGRPKAAKGINTIIRDAMTQKVTVRTASGQIKISRMEAVIHKTVELAMKGNAQAAARLVTLYGAAVPDRAQSDATAPQEELTAADLEILELLREEASATKKKE